MAVVMLSRDEVEKITECLRSYQYSSEEDGYGGSAKKAQDAIKILEEAVALANHITGAA